MFDDNDHIRKHCEAMVIADLYFIDIYVRLFTYV